MIQEVLANSLHQASKSLALPQVIHALNHPTNLTHGDYASNIALATFPQLTDEQKQTYSNPRNLAQSIIDQLKFDSKIQDLTSKIEPAGPGFINFTLSSEFLIRSLKDINQAGSVFGKTSINAGKTVIVEYSSPNIAKPFTVGHLRSTIIGDAVANILEFTGWHVLRDNHLGDWGTQFGKQIYAIKTWGNLEEIESSEHPVKILVDLYVKFHQEAEKDPRLEDDARAWFKKLEDGDLEARRLWQQCITWSWKEFDQIYQQLGVNFSQEFNHGRGLGESFFEEKMTPVIDELNQKKLLQVGKQGAQLFFFPEEKFPPAMIIKKDGATLYHTRDLASDKFRKDQFQPDLIINEVGSEQALYFQQLFEMEYMLGWFEPGQRVHIGHGLVRFKDKKMSTRKGDVIWLEDVLREAVDRATTLQHHDESNKVGSEDLAHQVAIGALKWNDLKNSTHHDILFDWNEVLNMKGNSGPYLQYTFARCASVITKSTFTAIDLGSIENYQFRPEELQLLRLFYRFPEVIELAAAEYAPHHLCTYLYELATSYNTFYAHNSILNADTPTQQQLRLNLTHATANILKNGLSLLAIPTPDKM
jgi:arginyl-tRNA synthetase